MIFFYFPNYLRQNGKHLRNGFIEFPQNIYLSRRPIVGRKICRTEGE